MKHTLILILLGTLFMGACKKDSDPSISLKGTRWTDTTYKVFPTQYTCITQVYEGDTMRQYNQTLNHSVFTYNINADGIIDFHTMYYTDNGTTVRNEGTLIQYKIVIKGDKLYLVSPPYDENTNDPAKLEKFYIGKRF